MFHFKKILLIVFSLSMMFISCSQKDFSVSKINYEYRNDYFYLVVEFQNNTNKTLVFPSVLGGYIQKISEADDKIIFDECTPDFQTIEELAEYRDLGKPLPDTEDEGYVYLLTVQPGHSFFYSKVVPYMYVPKENFNNKKIVELKIKYGLPANVKYDVLNHVVARGKIKNESILIPLEENNRHDIETLPTMRDWPFCDSDRCVDFERPVFQGEFKKFDCYGLNKTE